MIIEHPQNADIPALRQLWQRVFGDTDDFLDDFFLLAFSPERALVARENGEIRAALYWLHGTWKEKTVAYVYAVATKTEYRGQGLCRALMEKLHTLEKRTVLVPSDDGLRAFYGRLGYRDFGGMDETVCVSGGEAVSIEKLSAAAYMEKRKALLPAGSVLQEGDFLPMMEKLYAFYGGDGWLMAGQEEKGTFLASEFLGDAALLPGILKTLHCEKARVRSFGSTPFGMYRGGENSLPSYFAFALD